MAVLIDLQPTPEICFGAHRPSVVLESGQIWMDQSLPIREGAARLAHMQHHILEPPIVSGEDCLSHAMEQEVKALELELQWRLEFEVSEPFWPYEFEAGWRENRDTDLLLRFLHTHPDGGGGIAPLLRDYQARCLSEGAP
jgi:hypothetical protein